MRAIQQAQDDLIKRGSCIKCPILFMSSSRSLKPDSTWRDEYDEGITHFYEIHF